MDVSKSLKEFKESVTSKVVKMEADVKEAADAREVRGLEIKSKLSYIDYQLSELISRHGVPAKNGKVAQVYGELQFSLVQDLIKQRDRLHRYIEKGIYDEPIKVKIRSSVPVEGS